VVVVLPFDPVMPIMGHGRRSKYSFVIEEKVVLPCRALRGALASYKCHDCGTKTRSAWSMLFK